MNLDFLKKKFGPRQPIGHRSPNSARPNSLLINATYSPFGISVRWTEIPNGADGSPFVASARSIWNVDLAVFRSRHRLQAKLRAPHVPAESPDAAWHTGNRTPVSGYAADKWNRRIRIAPTAGLGIAAKPIICRAAEITLAHATWVIFLRPSDSRERTPVANTCQSA